MPLPVRPPRLRHVLLAVVVVALIATAATVALRRQESDAARATDALARVAAPGPGWIAGGTGLDAGWEEDTVHRDHHGVWTGLDPEDTLTRYVVTWDHAVEAGEEQAVCSQAAAWLRLTGPQLPGDPDRAADGVPNPSTSKVVARCTQALGHAAPGRTVDESFAEWQPGSRYAGYEFHAYLTFHGDAGHRTLAVTAQAQQTQS